MAITGLSDVFVPQVVGDVATNILFSKTPFLNTGTVKDLTGDIWADGGNTITLPYWDTTISGIVQDQVANSRTGVTPSKISMGSYTESVANKIVSIDFDKNILTDISSKADPNQHMGMIVAKQSAVAIQTFLIGKAEETDLLLDISDASAPTITVDGIVEAKLQRGEHAESEDETWPILYVHSKVFVDLAKSSDFKTLSSAATTALVQAGVKIPRGVVGFVHGCWVKLLDSLTVGTKASISISGITRSSTTGTATAAAAHFLQVGQSVTFAGADQAGYNTTFTVTSVPSSTTFTFTVAGSPVTPATGTITMTVPTYKNLLCWPGSVGLYVKKAVQGVLKDVHAGSNVATVDFDFRYAGTLVRERPRGVVVYKTR